MVRDWLRKDFKPEQVGKIRMKWGDADYVGHAQVTDRLNKVCPDWSYVIDETIKDGESWWVRMTMTLGEVSRTDFGDGANPKEAVSNAIRRTAMRFGVALSLWSREELESSAPEQSQSGAARGSGVDTAPGEVKTTPSSTSPGVTNAPRYKVVGGPIFPLSPEDCTHKTAAGHWVKWRKVIEDGKSEMVCPRCGLPQLLAMEG